MLEEALEHEVLYEAGEGVLVPLSQPVARDRQGSQELRESCCADVADAVERRAELLGQRSPPRSPVVEVPTRAPRAQSPAASPRRSVHLEDVGAEEEDDFRSTVWPPPSVASGRSGHAVAAPAPAVRGRRAAGAGLRRPPPAVAAAPAARRGARGGAAQGEAGATHNLREQFREAALRFGRMQERGERQRRQERDGEPLPQDDNEGENVVEEVDVGVFAGARHRGRGARRNERGRAQHGQAQGCQRCQHLDEEAAAGNRAVDAAFIRALERNAPPQDRIEAFCDYVKQELRLLNPEQVTEKN